MHKLYCAKTCKTWEHLEENICVPDTKQVPCDKTGINSDNGSIEETNVRITWSNGKWPTIPKCELSCETGYKRNNDQTACEIRYACAAAICEGDNCWSYNDSLRRVLPAEDESKCVWKVIGRWYWIHWMPYLEAKEFVDRKNNRWNQFDRDSEGPVDSLDKIAPLNPLIPWKL